MSKHFSKKPIALALSAAFAIGATGAQASVFQATDLGAGYMVAAGGDHKAGEGKCGEGKCGEGKCGEAMFKKIDANGDGNVTKDEFMKAHEKMKAEHAKMKAEGKCGEGKCGEGKCGGDKKVNKTGEGKCGEGKCGTKK
jgi:uncharacterized low-complexity protein